MTGRRPADPERRRRRHRLPRGRRPAPGASLRGRPGSRAGPRSSVVDGFGLRRRPEPIAGRPVESPPRPARASPGSDGSAWRPPGAGSSRSPRTPASPRPAGSTPGSRPSTTRRSSRPRAWSSTPTGPRRLDWAVVFCEYAPFLPAEPDRARPPGWPATTSPSPREVALAGLGRRGPRGRPARRDPPGRRARPDGRRGAGSGTSAGSAWREAFGDRLRFGLEFGRLRTVGPSPPARLAGLGRRPGDLRGPGRPGWRGRSSATAATSARSLEALPITLALLAAWSLGEWAGWCLGPPGRSSASSQTTWNSGPTARASAWPGRVATTRLYAGPPAA